MKEERQDPGYDTCDYCGDCFPAKDLVLVNKEKPERFYPGYGGDLVCKECAIGQPKWYTEKVSRRMRTKR